LSYTDFTWKEEKKKTIRKMANQDEASLRWQRFEDSARGVICLWDLTKLALQQGWTNDYRVDDVVEALLDFCNEKERNEFEVMDYLMGAAADVYHIMVDEKDDYAVRAVAKAIVRLFEECADGNFEFADQVMAKVEVPHQCAGECEHSLATQASSSSKDDQKDEVIDDAKPQVDDDGWTTVTSKKKKGRRRN
jgi:hypothetical protein